MKFFADATINIEPDAQRLADIAIQVADAVEGFGVTPRVAMVSFSNFGSVKHPESERVEQALALVRAARPRLEIDGPMQVDYALDAERRNDLYPFSTLSGSANTLVFPTLSAANSAYKALAVLGCSGTWRDLANFVRLIVSTARLRSTSPMFSDSASDRRSPQLAIKPNSVS